MLSKRIIPCLDIKDGRTVKGVNFVDLRDAGDPVELGRRYAEEGADELVFLDITATVEKRKTLVELVKNIAKEVNIPFTVGGGISKVEDVAALLNAGADKISINSAAVKDSNLISRLSQRFGSQCVVLAIDAKKQDNSWEVYIHGGRKPTGIDAIEWAKDGEKRGAGEILLTSMDCDGTKDGFDIALTQTIGKNVKIPVIASGGAGTKQHFADVFTKANADAGLAASIFHFQEIAIKDLKNYLDKKGIEVRI
ncbi:MAG TPA: imidazole glycerol phosphate synthase subunit HisF [bacterium]|nr:imidazole glycerol phosphate synthase subunit HisF [bacterium]